MTMNTMITRMADMIISSSFIHSLYTLGFQFGFHVALLEWHRTCNTVDVSGDNKRCIRRDALEDEYIIVLGPNLEV